MSEYVDFHYMPLEGKITGEQVLKQTEDAINDLGNKVYSLDIDQSEIDEAIEKSNEAINTANSALSAVTTGRSVWFNNVAEMVATDIEAGVTAETKGYHVANDGGNALYLIRQEKSGDVVDGGSLIALDNGNMAELVTDGTVNVKQFGAIGNGTDDDTTVFQNTSSYAQAKGFVPFVGVATYKITGNVTGTFNSLGEVTITGGGTVDIINLQEVVSDVSDIRDEVVDETASAKAYSESAATSATNASNSASSASTTARALTDIYNEAIASGQIVAPAVDPTLTISGAAADAAITGQIRNIVGNFAYNKMSFTILEGYDHVATKDNIYIKIPKGERVRVNVSFSPNIDNTVRILYFYSDGTSDYFTSRSHQYVAPKDIESVGIRVFDAVAQTSVVTVEVDYGLGTRILDLPTLEQSFGIYSKSFVGGGGYSHSSTLDVIPVNILAGERVVVNVDFDIAINTTVQIKIRYSDATESTITTKRLDMTALKNIVEIGCFVAAVADSYNATVTVGYGSIGSRIMLLEKNESDFRSISLQGTKFTIPAGSSHSSTLDRVSVNIPAGTMYTVDITSDEIVNTIFVNYTDGTSASLGQSHNQRTVKADKDISSIGVYYTTVANDTDVIVNVYYGLLVDQNDALYVSEQAKDFTALFNTTSDCDTFFFYSDPHFLPKDYMTSHSVAYYKRNFKTMQNYAAEVFPATILCGGDLLNDSNTADSACYNLRCYTGLTYNILGKFNYHTLLGNHDTNYQGVDQLSQETVDSLMFSNEDTGKSYFGYKTSKTKYLCLDTGIDWDTSMTSYRWEQMYWLANELLQNTMPHVIVAMHIFSELGGDDFGTDDLPMTVNTLAIITAFNNRTTVTINEHIYDFTNATGTVHCILCGHVHQDIVYIATDNLPVVTVTKATANATTDIKFDMGFLDYTNGTLYLYRINGDEPDRTVTLR